MVESDIFPRLREIERELGAADVFMDWVWLQLDEHEWTQRDLADMAGVAEQHISRWVRGHVRPGLRSMLRLREAVLKLNQKEAVEVSRKKGDCGCP